MANPYKTRNRPDFVLSEAGELLISRGSIEQTAVLTAEALAPGDLLRQVELVEGFIGRVPWETCKKI